LNRKKYLAASKEVNSWKKRTSYQILYSFLVKDLQIA